MAAQRFVINAAAAAVTSTAKTLVNLIPSAAQPVTVTSLHISADAAINVLLELCESTQAGAGTSTDSIASAKQVGGFVAGDTTSPASGVRTIYTVEPTTLTRLYGWRFTGPGPFIIQLPLGREPQSLVSGASKYKGLAFRVTSASNVNVDLTVEWEE